MWISRSTRNDSAPALLPAVAAAFPKTKPAARCLPGSPLIGGGLYKLVQTPSLLIIILKDVIGYRQVFLDDRLHPNDPDPSWMGHSIGHWEGDTLAVDTVAFNDRSQLRIYPHTEKLHVTERYHRQDPGHLEVRTFIEDSGTFVRPWTIASELRRAPDQDVLEYVCNENSQNQRALATE